MSKRNAKEMAALLAKIDEQLGPLDRWSDAALVKLDEWKQTLDRRWMEIDDRTRCVNED